MMRALVMDFAHDKNALNINDEFMFGKSLLVCPVTKNMYSNNRQANFSNIMSKNIYLPNGAKWFDFWTGEKFDGGQTISKDVPIDIIPLYVKAGSILPIGPNVQFATQKKWDNLVLKVFTGDNGNFILYEDEFDNYNYENGAYTEIQINWDNSTRKLTIGQRKGSFNGMLANRTFTVILNDGTTKTVNYTGKKVVTKF